MGAPDPITDDTTPADVASTDDAPPLPMGEGPVTTTPPKPGWQTTEFYAGLAPLLVFLLASIGHRQIDSEAAGAILAGIGSVTAGGYAVYRQLLKATHVKAVAQIHGDRLAAAPAVLTIEPSDIDKITGAVAAKLLTGPATIRERPHRRPAAKRATAKRPPARARAKAASPAKRKTARR